MVQQCFTNLLKGDYSQLYLLIQVKRTNEKERERERMWIGNVDRGIRERSKDGREGKEIKRKTGKKRKERHKGKKERKTERGKERKRRRENDNYKSDDTDEINKNETRERQKDKNREGTFKYLLFEALLVVISQKDATFLIKIKQQW
jgi:hypothetical protein